MADLSEAEQNPDGGWGWEALGSEDDTQDHHHPSVPPEEGYSADKAPAALTKTSSERSMQSKKSIHSLTGITSSPSFQELERAIGATLALSLSHGELVDMADGKPHSPGGHLAQRHSSTNLTQQKVMQHRYRQQLHQSHRSPSYGAFKQIPNAGSGVPARTELTPFINETESRALILFHSPNLTQAAVREACSKFGVLYYIRPDFHAKGVTFISYFDLQAASAAKMSLAEALGAGPETSVHYSIMLHATNSNTEEFRLVVKNLPEDGLVEDFQAIFSRYGQLRSIQKTFSSTADLQSSESKFPTAYTVEYFNIQDARLAVSELSATSATLRGLDITVKFAPLDERKRQLCQQLLATLSRWRTEMANNNSLAMTPPPVSPVHMQASIPFPSYQHIPVPPMALHMMSAPSPVAYGFNGGVFGNGFGGMEFMSPMNSHLSQMTPMLGAPPIYAQPGFPGPAVRPGFCSYPIEHFAMHGMSPYEMPLVSHSPEPVGENGSQMGRSSQDETIGRAQNSDRHADADFHGAAKNVAAGPTNVFPPPFDGHYGGPVQYSARIGYQPAGFAGSAGAKRAKNGNATTAATQNDADFSLDLERVRSGKETRTTIMVRNIPNKYNQQMLLDEVNVHHKGTYDFFYLPIDFKNRCNVGYCFINFLEPKFIAPFVEEFNGQRWKSFNSEKICAVTFARIQGKTAMIQRFQNSSLLDKDDEYKPLLFYSSGPDKGKQEPFPAASKRSGLGDSTGAVRSEGSEN